MSIVGYQKSMKKLFYILFISLFIFSCENKREVITERHQNGQKKIVLTYKGQGSNEVLVEKKTYTSTPPMTTRTSNNLSTAPMTPPKLPTLPTLPTLPGAAERSTSSPIIPPAISPIPPNILTNTKI